MFDFWEVMYDVFRVQWFSDLTWTLKTGQLDLNLEGKSQKIILFSFNLHHLTFCTIFDQFCVCWTYHSLIENLYSHAVKLLLRPSYTHSPVGLGDTKETPFCNVTEDISLSDPRKGLSFPLSCLPLIYESIRSWSPNGTRHMGSWFNSEVMLLAERRQNDHSNSCFLPIVVGSLEMPIDKHECTRICSFGVH